MKKDMMYVVALVMTTILCFSGCSKNEDKPSGVPSPQEAETAVRELEKQEIQAILSKDLDKLRQLWDPGFTVNSPLLHQLVGRDQVLGMTQNDVISYDRFDRQIEHVRVMGDVVVTMGEEILVPKNNNPNAGQQIKRRFTNVWLYRNGQWVETNRHAHIVPPSN